MREQVSGELMPPAAVSEMISPLLLGSSEACLLHFSPSFPPSASVSHLGEGENHSSSLLGCHEA